MLTENMMHLKQAELMIDWCAGVLDEGSLGHLLADFAYHAMMYRMPGDIVVGLGSADPVPLGLPTEANFIAACCERTGRTRIPDWDFYLASNFFRLAAIFHGFRGRVLRGTASNKQAKERAKALPRPAAHARQAMENAR